MPPEPILHFERLPIPPGSAHLLLGIGRSTYAHYRSGLRELPGYHVRHMRTIAMLDARTLNKLIKEVCHGLHR